MTITSARPARMLEEDNITILNLDPTSKKELLNNWGWLMAFGILCVIAGLITVTSSLTFPIATNLALTNLVGWILFFTGIFETAHAFKARKRGGFAWNLTGAILTIVAGFLLLANTFVGMFALTMFLAAVFLIRGADRLITAFQLRPVRGWGWMMFSGVLSIALAILIWAQYPVSALWILGLYAGIEIVFAGWAMVVFSLFLRQAHHILIEPSTVKKHV